MFLEENSSSSSLIVHLIVVGFHHKKGHQIEYSYPLIDERKDDQWSSNLCSLALPDGAHNRDKDLIYFHLPSSSSNQDKQTLFGIAAFKQMDANMMTNKPNDITRNSIQKSVCLLLRQPLYGNLSEELELITEKYFEEKDFSQTLILEEFVHRINFNPPLFNLKPFSAKLLFQQYKRKTLLLFKLILLQKKVLVMLSPCEHLVKTILTLVSLIPEFLPDGLNECTLIGEKDHCERLISLNENEDIVFDRNDNQQQQQQQLSFNQIKLKTLKTDDEDEDDDDETSSSDNNNNNTNEDQINSNPILQRATSITNKLTDTFHRLTTSNPSSTILLNYSQSFDQLHLPFPYPLFNQNNLLHPYLSLNNLDLLTNVNVNSYLIGASNGLFRQQNINDFILIDNNNDEEEFVIQSSQLKNDLQLTTADLRFTQLFQDLNSEIVSEEEIRRLFRNYFFSLLSVALNENEEGMNDFNYSFVKSFQLTNAFRLWKSKGPYPHFDQILPRHPQAGQLNVTDVKLRVSHVLDETETGRKLKGALEDTSTFMGEKSRAATKVLGQAKNSLFSSFIGTVNQGKQWFHKSQSPPPPPE